jgi:hypothetical protein
MEIRFQDEKIASIGQAAKAPPTAQRDFDIITIDLPFDLQFEARRPGKHWVLSALRMEVSARRPGLANRLLGSSFHPEIFHSSTGSMSTSRSFKMCCSPRGLAEYEAFRSGGPVLLHCDVFGIVSAVLEINGSNYLGSPSPVGGQMDIEFSRENWASALRSCGLSASVLVEVPLLMSQSGKPSGGEKALSDALDEFDHGGATAWKSSISHIRPFLEKWRELKPLQGPDPRDGSAAERDWKLLTLREALYKCCHFWIHESKDACTREDALLALATFASLLNVLRP